MLSDGLLDEIAETRGFLNACASWRSEVKVERAAVDGRKEVLPQPGNDYNQRAQARAEEGDQENATVMKAAFQKSTVMFAKALERFFKTNLHANEGIAGDSGIGGVVLMAA